jgi:hypothetical protein
VRRYLPCEIAGTAGELGGAAVAYLATGSLAAAATTATVGASAGYYAAAYVSALRWSYHGHDHRRRPSRVLVSSLLALRSVAVEFGPAEVMNSVAVRPVAYYYLLRRSADLRQHDRRLDLRQTRLRPLFAIFSYERFKGLLARAQPTAEEVTDESVSTSAAA